LCTFKGENSRGEKRREESKIARGYMKLNCWVRWLRKRRGKKI
jgi:hypothetical protein